MFTTTTTTDLQSTDESFGFAKVYKEITTLVSRLVLKSREKIMTTDNNTIDQSLEDIRNGKVYSINPNWEKITDELLENNLWNKVMD